jgi:hypothetical protein
MADAIVREITVGPEGQVLLEGLPLRAGERIEVIVVRRVPARPQDVRYPLHGTPLSYDLPFDPAGDPDDWEANN